MAESNELQFERCHAFLTRERAVQRAGVAALAIFSLAGAAGAFGDGPVSATTHHAGNTTVTYQRFARTSAATELTVEVETTAADGEPVRLLLDRDLLDRISNLEIRPPEALKGIDAAAALFEVPAYNQRARLELHYRPDAAGLLRTGVGPSGSTPARVWQLIYP
jgi:hypothetical protein